MLGDRIGEAIEHRLPAGPESKGSRVRPEGPAGHAGLGFQPGPTEGVVLEGAVPHGAPHRPTRPPSRNGSSTRASVDSGDAMVDLVRRQPDCPRHAAGRRARILSMPNVTVVGSRPETRHPTTAGLDRVVDALGQHLIAAADAEHRPPRAARPGRPHRPGRWTAANPGRPRSTGSRAAPPDPPAHDDRVGRSSVTSTPGSQASASTSVTLDSRGNRTTATRSATPARRGDGRAQRPTSRVSSPSSHTSSSQGSTPSTGTPGQLGDPVQAGPQQAHVPAELVDHEARGPAPGRRRRAGPRCRRSRRTRRPDRCRRPPRPAVRTRRARPMFT